MHHSPNQEYAGERGTKSTQRFSGGLLCRAGVMGSVVVTAAFRMGE